MARLACILHVWSMRGVCAHTGFSVAFSSFQIGSPLFIEGLRAFRTISRVGRIVLFLRREAFSRTVMGCHDASAVLHYSKQCCMLPWRAHLHVASFRVIGPAMVVRMH